MDQALFQFVNGLAGRVPLLDGSMRLLVNDYFVPTTLFLLLIYFWFEGRTMADRESNQRAVIRVIAAFLFANAIVKACNLLYFRPRPFSTQEVHLLFYRPSDSSWPSNPAAVGFAFTAVIWQRNRNLGAVMGLLASLFAVARVYCGVHYPLDVVSGALVGVFAAHLTTRAYRLLNPLSPLIIELARRLNLA
jgi:undecaprenyl-diphosphatase